MTTDKVIGWHFLDKNKYLGYGDSRKVTVGDTLSIDKSEVVRLCRVGMHASLSPGRAISFKKGPVMCLVEVWGDLKTDSTKKFCGRHRKVLWMKRLLVKDLKKMYKDIGKYCHWAYTAADFLSISYSHDINKWLLRWAKMNGAPVPSLAPKRKRKAKPVKRRLSYKIIISLLNKRYIKTEKEMSRGLSELYDKSDFGSLLDDLVFDGLVVEIPMKNGCGFVLSS